MLIWQDEPRKRARIEIVPMIDVMMFLLVFFVLISLHVIPALGIKTQLPSSAQPAKLEIRKHVVITIGKDGQIQLDGADYTLAGLRSALTEIRRQSREIDVVVNGDRDASVQQLVDAMDAVKSSGITSIAIASSRQGG